MNSLNIHMKSPEYLIFMKEKMYTEKSSLFLFNKQN